MDAPGFIQVRTGLDLGSVNVEVRAGQPSDPQDWEGVEEVSVFLRQQLRAESVSDEWLDDTRAEPRFIVTAPGVHRVRLSCRDRLDDFQEWVYPPEHEPVESFLVEVWPAPHSPRAVVRADGLECPGESVRPLVLRHADGVRLAAEMSWCRLVTPGPSSQRGRGRWPSHGW